MNWKALLGVGLASAAAPFTGGASLAALPSILGSAAKSASDANQLRDRNNLVGWQAGEDARLARDKFAEAAPSQRLSSSLRSSLLSNYKPTSVEWGGPGSGLSGQMPKFSGGYSEGLANLDPQTRELAQLLMSDSLASQKRGGATGGNQDRYVSPMPEMGKSSLWDKILGGAAFGSSILSGTGLMGKTAGQGSSLLKRGQPQPPNLAYQPLRRGILDEQYGGGY